MGRSPRVRRRRRKIGRIIVAFLVLVAVGVALRVWLSGADMYQDGEPSVVTKNVVYFEEPVTEPPEEPVPDYFMYRGPPFADHSNAIVLHTPSPVSKVRAKVAAVAKRAQKLFVRFVISLTPPWGRICTADPETCRNTNYMLHSIGPA